MFLSTFNMLGITEHVLQRSVNTVFLLCFTEQCFVLIQGFT